MTNQFYFISPLKSSLILGIFVLFVSFMMSYSAVPPAGKTGAPGEPTCMACHTAPNPDYAGFISLEGLPTEFAAYETYSITLNSISTGLKPNVAGFQITILDTAGNNVGVFDITDLDSTNFQVGANNRAYINHHYAKPFNSDTVSWSFDWTAPSTPMPIRIYASTIFADGSGTTQGDTVFTKTVSFQVGDPLEMEVVIDNVSEPFCKGGTNGIAHATILHGTQPYEYLWSTGDSLAWVYTLAAGTYSVTVTDSLNNEATQTVTIGEPDSIIANIAASALIIPCGDSVTLHVYAEGGTGGFQYTWNTGAIGVDSIVVYETGYYCVTVIDSSQCAVTVCTAINADQNGIFCNGISADSLTCNIPTSFLYPGVTANDSIIYNWSGPNGFESSEVAPQITQGGLYTLTASLPSGCSCSSSIDVLDLTQFDINITELTPASCAYSADGAIATEITAGAIEPFTLVPNNLNKDSLNIGDYSVTVTNGVGCTTVVEFSINGPDSIQVVSEVVAIYGSTPGSININTTGGTPDYSYTWITPNGTVTIEGSGSLTDISTPGDYYLEVADQNGCTYSFGPYSVALIDKVQDLELSQIISISPNPAQDYLTITQNNQPLPLNIKIFNTTNQLIKSFDFSERKKLVDINDWPSGLYNIVIQSKDRITTKQIMVQ